MYYVYIKGFISGPATVQAAVEFMSTGKINKILNKCPY